MSRKLSVLVADDTATFRMILKNIINGFDNCQCTATAPNGRIAVRKVRETKPDLVIMDVEMPQLDGPGALMEIRKFDPRVPVIIVSSFDMTHAIKVLSALENGALDFVTKPQGSSPEESERELARKLKPLIDMVEVRSIFKANGRPTPPAAAPRLQKAKPAPAAPVKEEVKPKPLLLPPRSVELVLIATSTGGPNALKELIPALPAGLARPVLVVQHMPSMFTRLMAENLDKVSNLRVTEAVENEVPQPGGVYIAPGGRHMILRKSYEGAKRKYELRIVDTPPVNSCRPAADVLFRSVSRAVNGNVLAVVMTGMGNDGTEGVAVLKQKSAYCIIQDEASSVVWGMPQEVHARGLADEVLPLDQIAKRIIEIVN